MITKECSICGRIIIVKTNNTKYCVKCKKHKQVEWTMKCRKKKYPETEIGVGSGNSSRHKGKLSTSYKTGIGSYHKAIKDMCEICGSKEHLCVHHKDTNRKNNNPENLQTLCRSCHTKEHLKLQTLLRDSKGRFTRAK